MLRKGEEVKVKGRLTCTSTNVVYCITCRRGGRICPTHPQYIGETGKQVKERARGHRGTVTQQCQENTTAPVGINFRGKVTVFVTSRSSPLKELYNVQ